MITNKSLMFMAAASMLAGPGIEVGNEAWRDMDLGLSPSRSVLRPRRNTNRMPHIGDKERARHAGKPDGPMHGLPPLFRA